MDNIRHRIVKYGLTQEQIEAEMAWLRCINFTDEKDVRRAAIEIKLSQMKLGENISVGLDVNKMKKPNKCCPVAKDGEWIQPKRKGYLMKCCDCGLVHKINFRLIKDKLGRAIIQFQAFRK